MIKLKSLISEINRLLDGESINLDDRFILKNMGDGIFKAYEKSTNKLALSILVRFHCNRAHGTEKAKIPWVSDVYTLSEFRKNGLYRKSLPILKATFGMIRSYDLGPMSPEAEKAWKNVGARRVLTTDDKSIYGDFWYIL